MKLQMQCSQTAIAGAMEISKEAVSSEFECETFEKVWEKVDEELTGLKGNLRKKDFSNTQEELGNIIFTLINIAHWCKLNPEEGLARKNQRFLDRFSYVESKLEGDISKYSLNTLRETWKAAKKILVFNQEILQINKYKFNI